VSTGKAILETQDLLFRGDFRLRIPLGGINSLMVHDGVLTIFWPEGMAEFDLGPLAIKWESRIRNPKSLVEKLGVRIDSKVAVYGIADGSFLHDLRKRSEHIVVGRPTKDADVIFLQCDRAGDLRRIGVMRKQIKPDGAVWIVYPKTNKNITQSSVFSAGKKAGMVDIKVASFSDTHTALKFVIPKKKR
jgi:hypothetical protein